ncbi:MAG: hypothetical protein ACRDCV_13795 [Plesiomonas shigelloides]
MAKVKNNTKGIRYVGEAKLLPGKEGDVADADLQGVVAQSWLESGDIEIVSEEKATKK